MTRIKNLQELFRRYRRPGDMVFAMGFFVMTLILLANLPGQTEWVARTQLFAQPAFWPTIALGVMFLFSLFHLAGAFASERISGRREEVLYWAQSLEYVAWFMAYVFAVPWIGYLPATLIFCMGLAFRLGYRGAKWMGIAALFGLGVVVAFKGVLQVRIPAGAIYEWLPNSLRGFMMTYF